MTYINTLIHDNAGVDFHQEIYECDRCFKEVLDAHPQYQDTENDHHLCWNCGFIEGYIPKEEYLQYCGIYLKNIDCAYHEGQIVFWTTKTPPWEKTEKKERRSKKYEDWRTAVFQRDGYTCQTCKQLGGELNAHHKKSFKKYPKDRYVLDNGITLCTVCHQKEHKKNR